MNAQAQDENINKDVSDNSTNIPKNKPSGLITLSFIGFIGVIISVGMGFYKMFVYENNEDSYFDESVNAYVGGDAYNFIINGTYSTSYFVLALMCMVFSCTMLLLNKLGN